MTADEILDMALDVCARSQQDIDGQQAADRPSALRSHRDAATAAIEDVRARRATAAKTAPPRPPFLPVAKAGATAKAPAVAAAKVAGAAPVTAVADAGQKLTLGQLRLVQAELNHLVDCSANEMTAEELVALLLASPVNNGEKNRRLASQFIQRYQVPLGGPTPPKLKDRFKRLAEVAMAM